MVEEKFNQQQISNLFRNGLTLRYDPSQKTTLPIVTSNDFSTPNISPKSNFIEENLTNSIQKNLNNFKSNSISIALSAGLDSSLILGLLRRTIPNLKINAISIKFAESNDETIAAKKIADFFDADHEVIHLENYLLELPTAIGILGLPFWDIHWYYIAKTAKTKSEYLASGDGGDELFGGYTFRYLKFLSLIDPNSTPIEKVKAYLSCHERDWVPDQEKLFNKKSNFTWDSIYSVFLPFFDNSLSPLNQVFLADYNGKLLYNFSIISNKINNFFNLKPITPILEPELIQYASHLSTTSKYDSSKNLGKLPLRKLFSQFNADSLIPSGKYGFSVNTINLWNSFGKELCNSFLDNARIIQDGWINKDWISSHINQPDLDVRYVNKFLGLLSFEIWYRIFITKEMNPKTKLS